VTAWAAWLVKGCGTEAAYRRHLRSGQKACDACKLANAQAVAIRKERRAA